jgi:hypothetical protein
MAALLVLQRRSSVIGISLSQVTNGRLMGTVLSRLPTAVGRPETIACQALTPSIAGDNRIRQTAAIGDPGAQTPRGFGWYVFRGPP